METVQPTLKSGRDVWDRINMPEIEFKDRVQKIRSEMKREGIDILLVYGSGPDHYGDQCYVSNFVISMTLGALVIVPLRGEVVLIFEGSSRDLPSVQSSTWVEQIRSCSSIPDECFKYFKENNLNSAVVGLVGLRQFMPYFQLQSLLNSISTCKIVNADHVIRDLRVIKSQRESDQIKRASRILSLIFDHAANNSLPGMNEKDLEASLTKVGYLEGAQDIRMLIAKPRKTKWALRPVQNAPISPGDNIAIYLAVEFEGYWAEGIRNFVADFGWLKYSAINRGQELYQNMVQNLKIGKTIQQFYKETINELEESKIKYFQDYGFGYGIGLSLQEFPTISENDTSRINEGMFFTMRLALNDKKMGGILVGDTVQVTKEGPGILTK